MPESRLQYLFHQWFNRLATPEEFAELTIFMEQEIYEVEQDHVIGMRALWKTFTPDREMHQADADHIFSEILREGDQKIKRIARRILRIASAAVITGILITVYILFSGSSRHNDEQTVAPFSDIAPGVTKAVLTLADGTAIPLDSAGIQVITQGKTKIRQQGGQLLYPPATVGAPLLNTVSTPRAGQYSIVLPDGSKAWLNAASSIRFPLTFTGASRTVAISGEVYFEVTQRPEPFLVNVHGRSIIATTAARFNIKAYESAVAVNLTAIEGKMQLSAGASKEVIAPGTKAQIPASGDKALQIESAHGEVPAWKDGWFRYRHAPLKEVMDDISHWYDVTVEFESNSGNRIFEGSFSRSITLKHVVAFLKSSGVRSRMEGQTLIILP